MEMTILYLFFCTGEEQQGPGTLTIWSHPPQAQQIYSRIRVLTLGSNLPGKMSAGPEGMHFFIKWSKTNQMGRCVQRTKGRCMCPVPAMEAYMSLFHSLLTPLPLHLSIPGMVELCGYNPAKYNTHIGAAMYHHLEPRKR